MLLIKDLSLFAPELVLIAGTLMLLLIDLAGKNSARRRVTNTLSSLFFLVLAFCALFGLPSDPGALNTLFSGMVSGDKFSFFFKVIILCTSVLAVVYSYLSDEIEDSRTGEYYSILMSLTLACFILCSATHILMIFLSLEFVSITSYVLTGYKSKNPKSSEAALKYAIYGAMASGIMFFGFSYLYGLTGQMEISRIGQVLSQNIGVVTAAAPVKAMVLVAYCMVLVGFIYKVAAVPFHMWCPDAYEGAPTPITAFLSVAPKAAGFAVLIRFLSSAVPTDRIPLPAIIGIISVATMTLGNLVAIHQINVKRLLAYSSIAHAGYMLMAVTVGTQEGVFSILFYIGIYLLMNMGAFFVVIAVRSLTGQEDLPAYNGLVKSHPLLAVTMAVFLFSLVGLPPLSGFIGKFYLFVALMKKAGFWYYLLALAGIANSAVSLFYYARVIKAMFLVDAKTEEKELAPAKNHGFAYALVCLLLALPVLALGVYWAPLQSFAQNSTEQILGSGQGK